ncbi:alpha/beta fold hydrolase [Mycobacterium simiae]|uniref:Alpha/beta fold hydrolase n=1 Tax=Mycobacterium simiae TaxID=1784 RepID=A0A5B1BRI8_MYCSI|nr:alpha/beta fold hydrolase [Mycobacterium simiae]KAA1250385.1 alpha/beta fold hydrolase [Mycobacterium simiae]
MRLTKSAGGLCVLVLPGGKVRSDAVSRWWQLANLRMVFLTRALRRRLGHDVYVRRVQYRRRGWNSPHLDAVRDAQNVLDDVRQELEPKHFVLVGHSMGGRVAAQLAARTDVGAVVALAPWWTHGDGDLIRVGTRLLVLHGTADTWTDPRSSRAQTCRARQRGIDAHWVGIQGAGHYMVRGWRQWHSRTTDFVAEYLADTHSGC